MAPTTRSKTGNTPAKRRRDGEDDDEADFGPRRKVPRSNAPSPEPQPGPTATQESTRVTRSKTSSLPGKRKSDEDDEVDLNPRRKVPRTTSPSPSLQRDSTTAQGNTRVTRSKTSNLPAERKAGEVITPRAPEVLRQDTPDQMDKKRLAALGALPLPKSANPTKSHSVVPSTRNSPRDIKSPNVRRSSRLNPTHANMTTSQAQAPETDKPSGKPHHAPRRMKTMKPGTPAHHNVSPATPRTPRKRSSSQDSDNTDAQTVTRRTRRKGSRSQTANHTQSQAVAPGAQCTRSPSKTPGTRGYDTPELKKAKSRSNWTEPELIDKTLLSPRRPQAKRLTKAS